MNISDKRIGMFVTWRREASFSTVGGARRVEFLEIPKPKRGVLVGVAIRYTGSVESGSYDADYGGYEPNYFSIEERLAFWEVRTGWRNKTVLVADADLQYEPLPHSLEGPPIPFTAAAMPAWTTEARDRLRKDMADWPRDSKGRYVKYDYATASKNGGKAQS